MERSSHSAPATRRAEPELASGGPSGAGPRDRGSGHDHAPRGSGPAGRRRLRWVLALVLAYAVAELVGGWWTGSLALVADAGHMFSDAASLALALLAMRLAARARTPERTFGHHRGEVLIALVNAATLFGIAAYVLVEAVERLREPTAVAAPPMIAVALGGLAVNLLGLHLLAASRDDSLNLRGAWLHVVADALGSLQVLIAGGLIWAFDWTWADPAASLLIALLVARSAWPLLRDAVHVLMEGTPRHLDSREVERALAAVAGVTEVHDLHLWTITSGFDALAVHLRVAGRAPDVVLEDVRGLLREHFGLDHSTVQIETGDGCRNAGCVVGTKSASCQESHEHRRPDS